MRLFTPLALALATACGGAAPCARSFDCRDEQLCGLEGRCSAAESLVGLRFVGSHWVPLLDWGLAGRDPVLNDALVVGGPGGHEALLAFGPLPPEARIVRALLVVHPHDDAARLTRPAEVVVERVGEFRGGRIPRRRAVTPAAFAAARRWIPEGVLRPARFDVTAAARRAAGDEPRTLRLLLRTGSSERRLLLASPAHYDPRARPRLELMTH